MTSNAFITGIPKSDYRIRLKTSDIQIDGELDVLIEQFRLSATTQDDGFLLVYGAKEDVMAFLKEVRRKIGGDELK